MKNILVIGQTIEIAVQQLKKQYGEDCVVYTSKEAQKEGLSANDFLNTPTLKVKAQPLYPELMFNPLIEGKYKLGKGGKARNRTKFKNR